MALSDVKVRSAKAEVKAYKLTDYLIKFSSGRMRASSSVSTVAFKEQQWLLIRLRFLNISSKS